MIEWRWRQKQAEIDTQEAGEREGQPKEVRSLQRGNRLAGKSAFPQRSVLRSTLGRILRLLRVRRSRNERE